jgi:hypothetical protein
MLRTPGWSSYVRLPALVLAALLVLGSAVGCAARRGAEAVAPKSEAQDNECLQNHLSSVLRRQTVGGVAGSGRLQFVSRDGRGRASFDFVFHRPDALRLIFHSPLGPVAAVLDLRQDRYLFADFREGFYIQGLAGEEDLFRLTGLPLEPRVLMALLVAESVPGNGGVEQMTFDEETCLPLACDLGNLLDPGLPMTVAWQWPRAFTAWDPLSDGLDLPERVVFSGPGPDRKTTVRFKSTHPLTAADLSLATEGIDLSRLERATLGESAGDHLPCWIGQSTEKP